MVEIIFEKKKTFNTLSIDKNHMICFKIQAKLFWNERKIKTLFEDDKLHIKAKEAFHPLIYSSLSKTIIGN